MKQHKLCSRLAAAVAVMFSVVLLGGLTLLGRSALASANRRPKASAVLIGLWTRYGERNVPDGMPTVAQVKDALVKGADPNAADEYGNSALQYAVNNDNLAIAKQLVSAGASIKGRRPGYPTPLSWSVTSPDCLNFLLSRGASVNAVDCYGMTAFLYAAEYGPVESLRLLVEKGADINVVPKNGRTALMWAAWQGQPDNEKFLIAEGADVNATNLAGETPLKLAEGCPMNRAETVAILKAAGAR